MRPYQEAQEMLQSGRPGVEDVITFENKNLWL